MTYVAAGAMALVYLLAAVVTITAIGLVSAMLSLVAPAADWLLDRPLVLIGAGLAWAVARR